uniref:UBC core domain-containing protein n=1 Tax=Euplotes harpa TaxID=151035 RepID=A0A7S3JFC2_9SPIT|mmetsp:Transcript_36773/g.42287  ORF Transcript_36773/g.42287 Transcript_36773/m.42287 type:complete len:237 (+) Transcript_36773:30-740(+)
MEKVTLKRIQKEYQGLQENPGLLPNAFVVPNSDNLLEWHFAVYGLDEPYKGGVYHGVVILPENYPKAPPGIKVLTPSGRFTVNYKLCLSISDWHPESWNPSWKIYQIILGLISVMSEDVEFGVGMIMESKEVRRQFAKDSIEYNLRNPMFKKLFEPYFSKLNIPVENGIDAKEKSEEEKHDEAKEVQHNDIVQEFERQHEYAEKKRTLIDYIVPIGCAFVTVSALGFAFYRLVKSK